MTIPHWGYLRTINHRTFLVPFVLEPGNWPEKGKDSKETTVTVIKINCLVNRCTSKYPFTRRYIVHWQLSKLLNKPLYPQISIDVENKSVVLNKIVVISCILSSYMYIDIFTSTKYFLRFQHPCYISRKGIISKKG